jgi:hypothetical protein
MQDSRKKLRSFSTFLRLAVMPKLGNISYFAVNLLNSVLICWVLLKDPSGKLEPQAFLSTDNQLQSQLEVSLSNILDSLI